MSAGERIRAARKRKNLTQKELAERVGCSQQTVVDIEGQDEPKSRFLSAIVRELGESLEWIETGLGSPAGAAVEASALPHFDLETVGLRALDPAQIDHAIDSLYSAPLEMSRMAFTVGVDRMTARTMGDHVREDDVLFVDPGAPPYLGRLVLAVMPGWDRAELRVLSSTGGRHYLELDNELYGEALTPCEVYRSAEAYRAHSGELAPALVVGPVVFVGREV